MGHLDEVALTCHTLSLPQPQFIHLAQLWSSFQDEMVLLSVLSNILASLEPFTRVRKTLLTPYSFKTEIVKLSCF